LSLPSRGLGEKQLHKLILHARSHTSPQAGACLSCDKHKRRATDVQTARIFLRSNVMCTEFATSAHGVMSSTEAEESNSEMYFSLL
jgi:hypothetical protein